MSALADYIKEIVKPTFEDFEHDQTPRRGFLAAVAIFHSVDRAKVDRKFTGRKRKGEDLRIDWGKASMEFKIVDAVCHRFKHTKSDLEPEKPAQWAGTLSIGHVLSRMNSVEFRFTMIGAIKFLEAEAAKLT